MLWPWLVGGAVPARLDNLIATIPWRSFARESLRAGELPLWNPHNFCGHPLLGFPATGFLYPVEWGMLLVGPLLWERVNVVLHHALACVFMFGFLRSIGVWRQGALLGAISFSVGAHLLFHIPWVRVGIPVVWLPLLLYLVERARRGTRALLVTGGVGIAVGMTLLGGTPQIAFYVLAGFGLYAMAMTWRSPRALLGIFLGALLGLLAYGGQYVASRQLWRESGYARLTYEQTTVGALRPWQLPGAFLGGGESTSIIARVNYVGVLMLVMAPFAFAKRGNRTRAAVLGAIALGALVLSLGSATPLHRALWAVVPPMRSFRAPARCMFLAGTTLCVLGAMGSEQFLRRRSVLAWAVTAVVAGVLALGLCGVRPSFPGGAVTVTTLGVWGALACGIGFLARRYGTSWWVAGWVLLTVELYWYGMVRNRDLERAWVSLTDYARFARQGTEAVTRSSAARVVGTSLPELRRAGAAWERVGEWLAPNLETLAGAWGAQGYSPLKLKRYDRYMALLHSPVHPGAVDRHLCRVLNPHAPGLDLLRVRYILWPSRLTGLEAGFVPVVVGSIVGADLPLEARFGPCAVGLVEGMSVVATFKSEAALPANQVVAWVEIDARGAPLTSVPVTGSVFEQVRRGVQKGGLHLTFSEPVRVQGVKVLCPHDFAAVIGVDSLSLKVAAPLWTRTAEADGWSLYERLSSLPDALVFPAANAVFVADSRSASQWLESQSFDPAKHLVLEAEGGLFVPGDGLPEPATIVRYEPRQVEILTDSSVGGYLFLGDAYYPGWEARVDGRTEPIVPANVAFRAVRVPSGKHKVVMRFEQRSVRYGILLSFHGLAASTALCWVGLRRTRGRRRVSCGLTPAGPHSPASRAPRNALSSPGRGTQEMRSRGT